MDKGSLNYQAKKKEAYRIDYENVLMAQRLIKQKPSFPNSKMEKEHSRNSKIKHRSLSKDTMLKSIFLKHTVRLSPLENY